MTGIFDSKGNYVGRLRKRFCPRGHDKLVVGLEQRMCRKCRDIRRAADHRRFYLKHREKLIQDVKRYDAAHPEQARQRNKRAKQNARGVNFWVREARESV